MTLKNALYVVVRGKDSLIDLPLLNDEALVPSDGVTRCDLVFHRQGDADITFSSETQPTWFTLQQPFTLDEVDTQIIRVNLRDIPAPPGNGRFKVDVFLWDQDFTSGRLWATVDVEIRVGVPAPQGLPQQPS